MKFFALKRYLCNFKIRTKLIVLFVIIKVIPVLLIATIALLGMDALYQLFSHNTQQLRETTKEVVSSTASIAIEDSIIALDRKSQNSLELLSARIAQQTADFLYERDMDIRLLAKLPRSQSAYETFLKLKKRDVMVDESALYAYDEKTSQWKKQGVSKEEIVLKRALLKDNEREFHRVDPIHYDSLAIPIYKELVFFDNDGQETLKLSSLGNKLKNISLKENTYLKAEEYFQEIQGLKEGEIYVSKVIGAYVPSRIIGDFTKGKAQKAGIPFEPQQHGYAGKENPKGKRFEGIIRFITPVFEAGKRVGYVSLALDHRHIMEFTDSVDPLNYSKAGISDASAGNYAFMWDYEGRNISHARDYFIVGYDPATGKQVPPWLGADVQKAFNESTNKDLFDFLKSYPRFDDQSLQKKPSLESIGRGELGLDCRYLNFAPQCQGWMQLTEQGGVGSFIIFWSKVWKLTTAATIPYYTGQYGESPRGFGFVTIGANVDEFHKAADMTKKTLEDVLVAKLHEIDTMAQRAGEKTKQEVEKILNELSISTVVMIIVMVLIAIWLSNLLRNRLLVLLRGAQEYAKNNLSYRIEVDSNDEIGELALSFNDMAYALKEHITKEKEYNATLESRIKDRTKQLVALNKKIQEELFIKEQQEEKLKIFAKIYNNTSEALIITDVQGVILQVNPAFTRITQYLPEEVIGKTHKGLKSHRHGPEFYREMWHTILNKKTWEGEIWNKRKDGELYPALLSVIPILGKDGEITHFAGIQHDISIIKENEETLHQQAYYDPLTKLANRALGYDRLEHAIANAKEHRHMVAVLFLDLDKFKQINDTMGHDVGDVLLCEVGERLQRICKSSDTVSRLGGDEFLIILEDIMAYEEVLIQIEDIIEALSKPFTIEGQMIHTSTSLGATFYPADGVTPTVLLKNADIAMYRAKAKGRGVYELFTQELGFQVREAVQLEHALKEAIEKEEFVMHYQPIFETKTQKIIGFEGLMRWQHNDVLRYPDDFIPMLENTRMIIPATLSLLPKAFTFIRQLNEMYNQKYFLSINISSIHFASDEFSDHLTKAMREAQIKPSYICLEVTETIFLHDIDTVAKKLAELKLLGYHIALDDFGTGYSSLEYLKKLPIDKIKIDRSFVKELPDSLGDIAITTSVCSLGENFGLDVIAEGVETEAQMAFLKKIGCQAVQGYLFSKPLSESALLDFLKKEISKAS